jgi:hypothetical protein
VPVKIVLAGWLLLGITAAGITLSGSPLVLAATNTPEQSFIADDTQTTAACQPGETLPRTTSAIRLRVFAYLGPRVTVNVLWAGHTITHGERAAGWTAGAVTIPVKPLPHTRPGVKLCYAFYFNGDETGQLVGEQTTGPQAAQVQNGTVPGRIRVEYMRPGSSSWWSLALTIARHMGLGHAWSGTWCVLPLAALMTCVALTCARLILHELK